MRFHLRKRETRRTSASGFSRNNFRVTRLFCSSQFIIRASTIRESENGTLAGNRESAKDDTGVGARRRPFSVAGRIDRVEARQILDVRPSSEERNFAARRESRVITPPR